MFLIGPFHYGGLLLQMFVTNVGWNFSIDFILLHFLIDLHITNRSELSFPGKIIIHLLVFYCLLIYCCYIFIAFL